MGYCGSGASFEAFKAGFDRTISRGPDDSRIIDTGNGLLGFHRLSIMGLTPEGMQPFELEATELLARAVCHECDHLDGIMYTQHVEGPLRDVAYQEEEEEE